MPVTARLDPGTARRALRDHLLTVGPDSGIDPATIPHSFDTESLLDFSARHVGTRATRRDPDRYLPLVSVTGVAHALCGREETGMGLLRRGMRAATSKRDRARFEYHLGFHHHHRRGEWTEARELLERAYLNAERSRRLRGDILLALGTLERELGCLDSSERALRAALDLHLRELEPWAVLDLARVAAAQDQMDAALRLGRKSHALFRRRREWTGIKGAERHLAGVFAAQGDLDRALEILSTVISKSERTLHVDALGDEHAALADLRARTGDAAGARDAIVQAMRFRGSQSPPAIPVTDYQQLGTYLLELGEIESGLAAFDRAREMTRERGQPDREFDVLARALAVTAGRGLTLPRLDAALIRCREIVSEHGSILSRDGLLDFAIGCAARDPARPLSGPDPTSDPSPDQALARAEGVAELDHLLGEAGDIDPESRLADRLGDGVPGRNVPPADHIRRFLLQFLGGFFRSGDYTREFSLPQDRAKRHLRRMCVRGLIEREGMRKAARYCLAFHRGDP